MTTHRAVIRHNQACRKGWHIEPEEAYELRKLGALEWSQLRTLECPDCKTKLQRMPVALAKDLDELS